MKILKDFFTKTRLKKAPGNVMEISNVIGPLIDKVVWEVFVTHREELLAEPITYIVPAVWGAKKDGELTANQKRINEKVAPVVEEIFRLLRMTDLDSSQEFALNYLVRGIIVSKMTYMIEAFRNRLNERSVDEQSLKEALLRFKPVGSA
jgi:hypothetical protein